MVDTFFESTASLFRLQIELCLFQRLPKGRILTMLTNRAINYSKRLLLRRLVEGMQIATRIVFDDFCFLFSILKVKVSFIQSERVPREREREREG